MQQQLLLCLISWVQVLIRWFYVGFIVDHSPDTSLIIVEGVEWISLSPLYTERFSDMIWICCPTLGWSSALSLHNLMDMTSVSASFVSVRGRVRFGTLSMSQILLTYFDSNKNLYCIKFTSPKILFTPEIVSDSIFYLKNSLYDSHTTQSFE